MPSEADDTPPGAAQRQAADWIAWHREYDEPASRLARRLAVVQAHLRSAIDERPGPLRIVSMCAGEGRDVVGVLAAHRRRDEIDALLIELNPRIAETARAAAAAAGLTHVRVAVADASSTDSYAGAVPADIVLACGVFGNMSDGDIRHTVSRLPELCAPGATVIWTRGRSPAHDLVPTIQAWFSEAGFNQVRADVPAGETFSVVSHRLVARPRRLESGVRLFRFVA